MEQTSLDGWEEQIYANREPALQADDPEGGEW